MHSDTRTKLAVEQLELVRALAGHVPAPAEFDGSRIQAAADALLQKRSHSVARVWPEIARSLGDTFANHFALYAGSHPLPEDGALADGLLFVRTLGRQVRLGDDAALELLSFDLRHRVRADGTIARRGFYFGSALLRESLRRIIAIRLPLLGESWIRIPLKIL